MNSGQTVFAQVLEFVAHREFQRCVTRYRGDYRARSFTCWDQFLCMAFAQLSYRYSLRETITCLRAVPGKLYHLGIRGRVSRSTLADANERRDWRIYRDLAQTLMLTARQLYVDQRWSHHLSRSVYAFDSTIIELCLTLCPWAQFGRNDAAVKMHTLLDTATQLPSFIHVTPRRVHDANLLDELPLEPGAVYVFDRGYVDYKRLYRLNEAAVFFVVRGRRNSHFRRQRSLPIPPGSGVRSDQIVKPARWEPQRDYPQQLRRIRYVDVERGKRLIFLTNNFTWAAQTIADLYKSRWQVELFFKWIKQHLRIKAFYGTSENAVKVQIWIAVTVYLVVAILRKRLRLPQSLNEILQVLSVSLYEKVPLSQLFAEPSAPEVSSDSCNQLLLFDF